jgi:hypothetical protein
LLIRLIPSCGFQDAPDRNHHLVPVAHFLAQAPPPGGGEPVEANAAARLGESFLRNDPTFELHAMEGRIERSLVDAQEFRGNLADALRDPPSVHRTRRERLEYEQIESPLQKTGACFSHDSSFGFDGRSSASSLLSNVNNKLLDIYNCS